MSDKAGWAVVGGLIVIMFVIYAFQEKDRNACRDRGGVPVLEPGGKITCAKKMETTQ